MKLLNFVTNNVQLDREINAHKNSNLKTLAVEPGTPGTQSGCVTTALPSPLRVLIVVELFNCSEAMGRNVNKQCRICGPHIFT